ncbi:porin [Flammeovirga agarivorans]|uniref:Uncharacterized protein n=1 Tax=Flammeovirga agarivorans TaxID=2726742 RepID=A0A7X8SJL3_9BACT|nr:porin [Flammeovirga agarivorans]NLR91455.1 hypothetical protein [Flammeovirga agarivorans]
MKKLLFICLFILSFVPFTFASDNPKESNWKSFQDSLTLTLDSRLDFRSISYQQQTDQLGNDQRFQFSDFRIGLEGKFNQNFGFQFLYSPNDSRMGMNNLSDNILYANVHYTTHNERWHIKAGRSFLNVGTVEQSYNPNDVYTYSIIGNKLGVFKTGITTEYRTKKGQRIGLQIVNANEDSLGHQLNLEYNFYWYGTLIKDRIKTFFSYTTIHDKTNAFTSTPYAVNLGVRWKMGNWLLDTDYAFVQNMPNFRDNTMYQSIPIRFMYNGKKFKPSIKYIYDHVHFLDGLNPENSLGEMSVLNTNRIHTLEVALQYYPFPDRNLRFHLVGSYASDTYQYKHVTNSEFFNSKFTVSAGVRIGFDVLKGR